MEVLDNLYSEKCNSDFFVIGDENPLSPNPTLYKLRQQLYPFKPKEKGKMRSMEEEDFTGWEQNYLKFNPKGKRAAWNGCENIALYFANLEKYPEVF